MHPQRKPHTPARLWEYGTLLVRKCEEELKMEGYSERCEGADSVYGFTWTLDIGALTESDNLVYIKHISRIRSKEIMSLIIELSTRCCRSFYG
jgi:hypothetical protein